jgi:hypothetical protein
MLTPSSKLSLNELRLLVRLGCSAEERQVPQYVSFNIEIRFATLPPGCESDSLQETVCYSKISQQIKTICERQEYQLIEKLGWNVYQELRETLPKDVLLWIRANKEHPPVAHLEGGAAFSIGDWEHP